MWFELFKNLMAKLASVSVLVLLLLLSGCTFQPLYGSYQNNLENGSLANIDVGEVNSRVGQQVRNHLLFLLHGGKQPTNTTYEVLLTVKNTDNRVAVEASAQDTTAGFITVTASYQLYNRASGKQIAKGFRSASASYDRTNQNFANERALRDAENRASQQAAEYLRAALVADLSKSQ